MEAVVLLIAGAIILHILADMVRMEMRRRELAKRRAKAEAEAEKEKPPA